MFILLLLAIIAATIVIVLSIVLLSTPIDIERNWAIQDILVTVPSEESHAKADSPQNWSAVWILQNHNLLLGPNEDWEHMPWCTSILQHWWGELERQQQFLITACECWWSSMESNKNHWHAKIEPKVSNITLSTGKILTTIGFDIVLSIVTLWRSYLWSYFIFDEKKSLCRMK